MTGSITMLTKNLVICSILRHCSLPQKKSSFKTKMFSFAFIWDYWVLSLLITTNHLNRVLTYIVVSPVCNLLDYNYCVMPRYSLSWRKWIFLYRKTEHIRGSFLCSFCISICYLLFQWKDQYVYSNLKFHKWNQSVLLPIYYVFNWRSTIVNSALMYISPQFLKTNKILKKDRNL